MNKAIFIDLDQTTTALINDSEPSLSDINTLKKAQREGWYVIIATGRSANDLKKIWKKIHYNDFGNYVIYSTGMNIENFKTDEIVQREVMDEELAKEYIRFCKEQKVSIKLSNDKIIYLPKKIFLSKIVEKIFKIKFSLYSEMNVNYSSLSKIGVAPSFLLFKVRKFLDLSKNKFPNMNFSTTGSKRYIEGNTKGIDKGQAAKKLAKLLNIDLSKSIAIGDSMNDLPMLEIVGYPVAVKNALKPVKQKANFITKSVYKSGVSHYLNYHFKNEK